MNAHSPREFFATSPMPDFNHLQPNAAKVMAACSDDWSSVAALAAKADMPKPQFFRYANNLREVGLLRQRHVPLFRDSQEIGEIVQFCKP